MIFSRYSISWSIKNLLDRRFSWIQFVQNRIFCDQSEFDIRISISVNQAADSSQTFDASKAQYHYLKTSRKQVFLSIKRISHIIQIEISFLLLSALCVSFNKLKKIASKTFWEQTFSPYLHHINHNFISASLKSLWSIASSQATSNQKSDSPQIFDSSRVSKLSNSTFLSLISSCSTSTILNDQFNQIVNSPQIFVAIFTLTYRHHVFQLWKTSDHI